MADEQIFFISPMKFLNGNLGSNSGNVGHHGKLKPSVGEAVCNNNIVSKPERMTSIHNPIHCSNEDREDEPVELERSFETCIDLAPTRYVIKQSHWKDSAKS